MAVDMTDLGKRTKAAAKILAKAPTDQKNKALLGLAGILGKDRQPILDANAGDVSAAGAAGLAPGLIDRLTLTPARLDGIAADLRKVIDLPDPVGERYDESTRPNGLHLWRQRVPLGVLGVIYESRPNVTVDVAGLAIKTGNAAILRGGSETIHSNRALVAAVHTALRAADLPEDSVLFVDDPDRARVTELLALDEWVDMIIPRGGGSLHRFCREHSRISVITGGVGICHLYVEQSADQTRSIEVIHNAKTKRPSVCNALDTVLVERAAAAEFLPMVVARLEKDGVTFRAHENALPFLGNPLPASVQAAGPEDFDTEWMALILGLKVVDTLEEAIEHIALHSQNHSDGILTENRDHAARFLAEVDSAAVYVNASTHFTDGAQFGLGAEVAISTQRLHARGPMGLRELTTYKWAAEGDYLIRA
ncbi:MAG: glutamate-5-semialdehyde dehydrogenase [Anaerolineales bacterium]|nr:glutamate-5-semialdehyde dehydrogenase [Anaerolineales bacterium]